MFYLIVISNQFSGRNITHLSDFNALRDQVTEMQRMFGSAYKTAGQHLQMINTMITTYNKATSMATATSNGKEALQAAIDCRETSLNLSKTFPPWLHENFDEFPLPTPKSVRRIIIIVWLNVFTNVTSTTGDNGENTARVSQCDLDMRSRKACNFRGWPL